MAENRELALVLKLVADQFQSELKKSGGVVGEFQKFIGDWRTQLTLAGTALFAIAKSTANFGEEALKTSQRLGLTVEKTTALQYAAHLADVPVMTLERGLQTLALRAVEAARGSGEGAKLFASLGISATDTAGKVKPLDQLFFEFQDRLKGVGNQAEFVEAGVAAFGKGFRDLAPMLRQGSDATKAMMEEGRKLGVVMSGEQAQAASRFNDELKRLDAQVNGVKLSIGNALIPTMRELIELFGNLGVGTGLSGGLQLVQNQLIRLNVLLKEMQANAQFLFGTGKDALSFDQLKQRLSQIEAGGRQQLFEMRHPGVLSGETSGSGGGASGGGLASVPTSEELRKKREDYAAYLAGLLSMAEDYYASIAGTGDEAVDLFNKELKKKKDDYQAYLTGLTSAGQEFLERRKGTGDEAVALFRLDQRDKDRERAQLVEQLQAWMAYDDQVGASTALRLQHQLDLVRANLAQQTRLTQEESGRLLEAWEQHDQQRADEILSRTALTAQEKETLEIQSLTRLVAANEAASNDIVAGWAKGMDRYVRDTQSGFGLGADMARHAAQMMEQSFRTFFFDVWDGKIKSMRDMLEGLADFAKQVLGTVFSQLATRAVLGLFGFGANAGGEVIQRFAYGGPVLGAGNRDTVPALLTPGEVVLSRGDVYDIKNGLVGGGGGVTIQINNYGKNDVQASQGEKGPDGRQLIRITVRDMVRGMIQGGDMDRSMSQRYGLTPAPGRR